MDTTRKITITLPADLLRKARAYAAAHDTTLNALVRDLLQEALSRESRHRAAADRLLALAERGPFFTADPGSLSRQDLHKRR